MIYYDHAKGYGGLKSVEAGLDYVPTHGWQYREHSSSTTTSGWVEDEHLTVSGEKSRSLQYCKVQVLQEVQFVYLNQVKLLK